MRTTTRILAIVAAAAVLGSVATPAHAVTARAQLFEECPDGRGNLLDLGIFIDGQVARIYPSGYRIVYRVWGDDPSSDDLLAGPFTVDRPAINGSLPPSVFEVGACSDFNSTFDEDIGTDEIYFGVRIFDLANGAQLEVVESNRIIGDF